MALFHNESEMQDWLQSQFDADLSLGDLIVAQADLKPTAPTPADQKAIIDSFNYVLQYTYCTRVISANSNISATKGEILKPDFVLYDAEAEGILVVELKNFSQATREAGTEIGAYSGEIRAQLPFIADADVMSVIISAAWPDLLKHYVVQEVYWRRRKLLCLEPVEIDGGIKLKTLSVATLASGQAPPKISAHYLGGYQICLYDDALQAGSDDRERFVPFEEQMKTAMRVLAAEGEEAGATGFAFLWKDNWEQSLAPYSITIVNFAPFQQMDSLLRTLGGVENATKFQEALFRVNAEYDPQGHSGALSSQTRAAQSILESFCRPNIEGFFSWEVLRKDIWRRSERPVAFGVWGAFAPQYLELLTKTYEEGNTFAYDNPELGWDFVQQLVSFDTKSFDWSYLFYDPDEDDF